MTIPQSFISELLARVDIVDVISSRVKLRSAGRNMVGLCPFHNEKTPSFTVSQNKQFFHCFGCAAHGSAIGFIMQFENLSFTSAVENLATQLGLTVPRDINTNSSKNIYEDYYKAGELAANLFIHQLSGSSKCISYLKSRGFSGKICKDFKVGYAVNSWNGLETLYHNSPSLKRDLLATGLLAEKNNKVYARFRDRIMFPIRNTRGAIIGFGGRTLGDDLAKYLNTPETAIFHKGEELYGLYEARLANHNHLPFIVVVEGYLDVIALAQADITNAVATSGTAISTKQVQLLLRSTQQIVFCFDGDSAGRGAAWRALENTMPLMRDDIDIKFLFLPEQEDPDSLVKKIGKERFLQKIDSAVSLADFFFRQLSNDINLNTIGGRAKFVQMGTMWLKKMPYSIFRQMMTDRIAKTANIDAKELQHMDQVANKLPDENIEEASDIPQSIKNAISILLHHPQIITEVENIDKIKGIKINGIELLSELITMIKNQPNLSMAAILEYWRDRKEFDIFSLLACKKPIISTDNLKNEFIGIIQLFKQTEYEQTIKALLTKATSQDLTIEERQDLHNLIITLKKQKVTT